MYRSMTDTIATAAVTTTVATTGTVGTRPADVASWLPLVWKVARSVARRLPSHIEVDELVGAGTIGLMDALTRYDASRCDRFAGYAEIRIRGAILDQLREADWMPRTARRAARRLDETTARVGHRLGAVPAAADVAEELGVSVADYERLRRVVHQASVVHDVDLDLQAGASVDAVNTLVVREQRDRLAAAIGALPERQQQLLSLYYVEGLKLKEIGVIVGVTESRVCQILRSIVSTLRTVVVDA